MSSSCLIPSGFLVYSLKIQRKTIFQHNPVDFKGSIETSVITGNQIPHKSEKFAYYDFYQKKKEHNAVDKFGFSKVSVC